MTSQVIAWLAIAVWVGVAFRFYKAFEDAPGLVAVVVAIMAGALGVIVLSGVAVLFMFLLAAAFGEFPQ